MCLQGISRMWMPKWACISEQFWSGSSLSPYKITWYCRTMNSKGTDQIVQYRPLLSTYAAMEHFPLAQPIYSFWTISNPKRSLKWICNSKNPAQPTQLCSLISDGFMLNDSTVWDASIGEQKRPRTDCINMSWASTVYIFLLNPLLPDSHIISTVTEPKVLNDEKHMKMPLCHNLSYVNSQGLDQLVPLHSLMLGIHCSSIYSFIL